MGNGEEVGGGVEVGRTTDVELPSGEPVED